MNAVLFAVFLLAGGAAASEKLIIVSGPNRHVFQVEVADKPAERARGLMFRASLAPDAGMLFDFGDTEPVHMWMKNTYIPLDMLFIRADGSIARVAENTEPFSLAAVSSGEPVRFVLEVAGGTASRLGIKRGDAVRHPLIPAE